VCEKQRLWLHVDAAYAGAAAILPEKRDLFNGWERADSVVFNPHKWLFTPMDLTALYCRRPDVLRRAFSLVPEYLRSEEDPRAVNFMEYAVPLGRRFRALKLWFVMRYFGRNGLTACLREHIRLAQWLADQVDAHLDFERMAPAPFSLVCFRYHPANTSRERLNEMNQRLLDGINAGGEFFLSHTKLGGAVVLRVAIGNIHTSRRHVERLWTSCKKTAAAIGG
jgi:aromatic-L-amino-acid decarboxylase